MVDFNYNITTEAWDERLFDCQMTAKGDRIASEIARKWHGERIGKDEWDYWTIDEAIEKYDLDRIGSGKTREVFNPPNSWTTGSGDCILKIQWDPDYHQTAQEIQVWKNANGRQAALLAPVLDWDEMYNWALFPRAEMYSDLTIKETSRIVKRLRRKMAEVGIKVNDIRAGNVGRVEGREVAIDYGRLSL